MTDKKKKKTLNSEEQDKEKKLCIYLAKCRSLEFNFQANWSLNGFSEVNARL